MGVDHGGANIFVAEEFLYSADVVTGFEEVSGEGVTEGVGGYFFGDIGLLGGFFEVSTEVAFVDMVVADFACTGIAGDLMRWKWVFQP